MYRRRCRGWEISFPLSIGTTVVAAAGTIKRHWHAEIPPRGSVGRPRPSQLRRRWLQSRHGPKYEFPVC